MKKLCAFLVLGIVLFAGFAQAQTVTPTPTPVTTTTPTVAGVGPFTFGMDTAILAEPGHKGFVAVGAGADIASAYGGVLLLHASALFPMGASSQSAAIVSLGVNVDMMKLLTKFKQVTILMPNIQATVGPVVAYDVVGGLPCYGAMFNLKYAF